MPTIIGLTGVGGARKTQVAKFLERTHGFDRIHAGKNVKAMIRAAGGPGLTREQMKRPQRHSPHAAPQLGGVAPINLMESVSAAVHAATPHQTAIDLRRRLAQRMAAGKSVAVDGVRSPHEASVIREMGGKIIRCDNGKGIDPTRPMDQLQASISPDYTIDTSGKKKDRLAAVDRMWPDLDL